MSAHASDRRRPPAWLFTDPRAVDTELGVLKTGKEADTHLVERRLGERWHLLACKHYRSIEHRQFRNDAAYRAGRRTGNRRDDLAMAKGTRAGMRMRAESWALREFRVLRGLWQAGAPVPYAVSCSGPDVLMEFIGSQDQARTAIGRGGTRTSPRLSRPLAPVCRSAPAHGQEWGRARRPLSVQPARLAPAAGCHRLPANGRPGSHGQDLELLRRDVKNVADFFAARQVSVDAEDLFGDLISFIPWPAST